MKNKINYAKRRISQYTDITPCTRSGFLSDLTGGDVFIKQEQAQVSGSFKIRGVLNKVIKFIDEDNSRSFVAASTGNHGIAFAHAMEFFGLNGTVWVPENISTAKLGILKEKDLKVKIHGSNCIDAEKRAREESVRTEDIFVHPYNDIDVIAGQGTIGLEILAQTGNPDYVLVPVGGGGLIAGLASILDQTSPSTKVIGCQPENSQVMNLCMKAGRTIVAEEIDTVSDATAGGVEHNSLSFDICYKLVKEILLLEESEIKKALKDMWFKENLMLEGGAVLSVAALIKYRERFRKRRVVLLTTGGRLTEALKQEIFGKVIT